MSFLVAVDKNLPANAWVPSLVWENPTCLGVNRPMYHNYWACALEPLSHQLPNPMHPRDQAQKQEKPPGWEAHLPQWRVAPACWKLEKAHTAQRRPSAAKNKSKLIKKKKRLCKRLRLNITFWNHHNLGTKSNSRVHLADSSIERQTCKFRVLFSAPYWNKRKS